jgi:hypothetical protein
MKYIAITILAISLSVAGYSQGSIYSIDYSMGFGTGDMGKYIGSASFRGFTFEGRGFVTDNVTIGGLFNWSTFYEEQRGATYEEGTLTVTGNQYRYINAFPLLVQGHYYLGEDEYSPRIYLGGGLGAYKINKRTEVGTWALEERKWHFGVSPEVGILLPVSMTTMFNISMRYHYAVKTNNAPAYSWFGLSVGFAWGD